MGVLSNLEPKKVFYYFEEITKIPHGSGNVEQISDFLVDFAKAHKLFYIQDAMKNVIMVKEATPGYENEPVVILQGHMDMVAVQTPDCTMDMKTEGLKVGINGDSIYAENTSLGGDDGIAVAYALALLDSEDIRHPRLEVIITVDEEVGMDGAREIDLSMLQGHRMINLDSEDEGIFLTSCAGGARVNCRFPMKKQELIDDIDADINDKRSYALKKAGKVIYENEPAGIPVKGERSDAEALTSEQVWKAYKELLRTARIEIFFVGRELPEKCEKLINDRFSAMDRGTVYSPSEKLSPLKPEVRYETERLDVLQSKMVMAYKTSIKSPAVRRVFTALFGGLPVSMLFMNVREKLSLCYYCAASFAEKSGVMFVDSGVESENIEPARKEIENQLALTAKGEFSDELLEQAKLAMVCALKGADDSPRNIADWYFSDCTKSEEDILSPEKLSELIEKVTKKQVMEFAASLKLDTVYVLTGKEN